MYMQMDSSYLHLVLPAAAAAVVVAVVLLLSLWRRCQTTSNHRPQANPILGNLVAFLANGHRFLDWSTGLLAAAPASTMQVHGPLGLGYCGVATASPDAVEHMLRASFHNYVDKGDRVRDAFADLLGDGLFLANGRLWRLQRKLAASSFSPRLLRLFAGRVVLDQLRRRLLLFFDAAADARRVFDLQDVLKRFAFDNICSVAFGVDRDDSSPSSSSPSRLEAGGDGRDDAFFAAFDDAIDISFGRILHPTTLAWKAMKLLDVGSERRLRQAIGVVDEYVTAIMESKQRCSDSEEESDLLSRFTAAMMEEDGGNELGAMFDSPEAKRRFLRDTVKTFVLAGKDTTSSALTWLFWFLAANPECERRVYEEVTALRGDTAGDERDDGYEELKRMHYLHAAITETMRLYPPVPLASRVAAADDVLPDGTVVRAGWFADYSSYAMGRMPQLWERDCGEFRPERWLDGGGGGGGRFVAVDAARYPVFHAGPRSCLGKEMAYVQMKAVAAAVVRRFSVEVVPAAAANAPPSPPPHETAVTLRMKGGLRVLLTRRRGVLSHA
ncbi:cytochrome P450 CYP94D108 [Oryza sativa Japonica Group]|nr:cytochrome P450 94A2 [Oryza sativa Japonica Group]